MPTEQELIVEGPDMVHEYFYVVKRGLDFQKWEYSLLAGDEIKFYVESANQWYTGEVHSWSLEDASGNCPSLSAHYFLVVRDHGKTHKYDLHHGLRIRIEAPTEDELRDRPKYCEGGEYDDFPYSYDYTHCHEYGKEYTHKKTGLKMWYCDAHKPTWLADVVL